MILTPSALAPRELSCHQVGTLIRAFESLDVDPAVAHIEPVAPELRAAFLAIRAPYARALSDGLRARGVHTDARGEFLRFGPAPYRTDEQLLEAMARFGIVLRFRC